MFGIKTMKVCVSVADFQGWNIAPGLHEYGVRADTPGAPVLHRRRTASGIGAFQS
jgi:hypothetical protein